MNFSIVIPVRNEKENVTRLYQELSEVFENISQEYEMIFIDDGSIDETFLKLQILHESDEKVKVIKFKKNFGQSAAIAAGFAYAHGKFVITMDADLQDDPADIPELLAKLDEGYDVVCGWRYNRKDTFLKKSVSRLSNWLRRRLTGEIIHDSGCSLRVYKKECLKDLILMGEMHRYIPALLFWRGCNIGEIKVSHRPRVRGKTKYDLKRLPKGLLDLLLITFWQKYSMRPIHMLGGMGLLLLVVGVLLGIYLAVERIFRSIPLMDRPLFLLVLLLIVIGVQFVVFGILADILVRLYYKQDNNKYYVVEEVID